VAFAVVERWQLYREVKIRVNVWAVRWDKKVADIERRPL